MRPATDILLAEGVVMDNRLPALQGASKLPKKVFSRRANPYEEAKGYTYSDNIWRLADTMAAERSRSEAGRVARACLYAWAMFVGTAAVLSLAMFGASILFVVRVTELIRLALVAFVKRRFRRRAARPRRSPEPVGAPVGLRPASAR